MTIFSDDFEAGDGTGWSANWGTPNWQAMGRSGYGVSVAPTLFPGSPNRYFYELFISTQLLTTAVTGDASVDMLFANPNGSVYTGCTAMPFVADGIGGAVFTVQFSQQGTYYSDPYYAPKVTVTCGGLTRTVTTRRVDWETWHTFRAVWDLTDMTHASLQVFMDGVLQMAGDFGVSSQPPPARMGIILPNENVVGSRSGSLYPPGRVDNFSITYDGNPLTGTVNVVGDVNDNDKSVFPAPELEYNQGR